jgi:hypothetical protein
MFLWQSEQTSMLGMSDDVLLLSRMSTTRLAEAQADMQIHHGVARWIG